jgi:hypothetical protein
MNSAVGGTSHGSVYDYDRHIPIVFMGQMIKPGRYAEESGPEDIAPTLARVLGLEFRREHDSRLLLEMLSPQLTMEMTPTVGATADHQH